MAETEKAILDARYNTVKKLTKLHHFERMAHLVVNIASFLVLLTCTIIMLINKETDIMSLTGMFGSTGLITITTGRILKMWEKAMKAVITGNYEK
ncbi:hypothetical protein [Flagellimonas sp.]|uniref:hypothetical protein n=1 Tax=Flagellimonas sp. TaxID=2058762 RepID=UPI003B506E47